MATHFFVFSRRRRKFRSMADLSMCVFIDVGRRRLTAVSGYQQRTSRWTQAVRGLVCVRRTSVFAAKSVRMLWRQRGTFRATVVVPWTRLAVGFNEGRSEIVGRRFSCHLPIVDWSSHQLPAHPGNGTVNWASKHFTTVINKMYHLTIKITTLLFCLRKL